MGGGEARAAPGSRRDQAPGRQATCPQASWLLRPSWQLRGARPPGVPARVHPPLSVCFPPPPQVAEQGQTAAAATAEALRQAGPERCEPAGCGTPADSGEEAEAAPRGDPALHPAGGRGPLGTARCGRIPQRAPAEEGLTVTHSYPPFIPPHPQTVKITHYWMLITAGKMPKVGD